MTRRWFQLLVWLALLIPIASVHPEGSDRARASRVGGRARGPNVLILVGDDHAGWALGSQGEDPSWTPRLDGLARQGVRFDRAYCNAPVCSASRQSFLTGRLPHAVGVTRLTTPLPDDAVTLGDWLTDLGYDTAAVGKMHFNDRSSHGFAWRVDSGDWEKWLGQHPPPGGDHRRRWRPFRDPSAEWLNAETRSVGLPESHVESSYQVDQVAGFFQRHAKKAESNPFAMVVGFHEPHAPFRFPDGWPIRRPTVAFTPPTLSADDQVNQPKVFQGLTLDQVQGIQASYSTSVNFLDHQVGRVLDALEAASLADDTIVVYLGDNGYLLGQHGRFEKHCFFEASVRVPWIIRWPGHLPEGRRVADLVELVDLVPTLLDLSRLPKPPDLHGQSLRGLLEGQPRAKGREVVVSEYLENEEAMVRSGRYKLVVGNGTRRRLDGYESNNPTPGSFERLYDLEVDPGELTNVRDRLDLAPVVADLRRKLLDRLRSTRSPRPAVPAGLSDVEALRWCLIPQD